MNVGFDWPVGVFSAESGPLNPSMRPDRYLATTSRSSNSPMLYSFVCVFPQLDARDLAAVNGIGAVSQTQSPDVRPACREACILTNALCAKHLNGLVDDFQCNTRGDHFNLANPRRGGTRIASSTVDTVTPSA